MNGLRLVRTDEPEAVASIRTDSKHGRANTHFEHDFWVSSSRVPGVVYAQTISQPSLPSQSNAKREHIQHPQGRLGFFSFLGYVRGGKGDPDSVRHIIGALVQRRDHEDALGCERRKRRCLVVRFSVALVDYSWLTRYVHYNGDFSIGRWMAFRLSRKLLVLARVNKAAAESDYGRSKRGSSPRPSPRQDEDLLDLPIVDEMCR